MARGLGRGMGALLGEDTMQEEKGAVAKLPVSRIEPRKGQPRENFDEEKLTELAESIREHGMIQPITVRPLEDGFYQIIAGERRWRAARMAGLAEVPVNVMEAGDRETAELAMIENLQREDLNPIEEARGYRALMDGFELTQEQVAERVGKSRPVVANALRLLRLSPEAVKLLEDGKLSLSHARAILEVEDPDTRTELAKIAAERELSVREVTALAKKMTTKKKPKPQKKNPRLGEDGIDYMTEIETELGKRLGRKVKIDAGAKTGTIKIDYYDREDFERLIETLRSVKGVREWN